jgi:ATP-dependent Zn protease
MSGFWSSFNVNRLLAFAVIAAGGWIVVSGSSAADPEYLRYENFIAAVESGQVQEVRLDEYSTISGILKENGKEQPFESYGGRIGTANDPLLLKLLKEHNVKVAIEPRREQGFWSAYGAGPVVIGIVGFLLPIATFVYVVLIYNRLRSARKNSG